jgi:hypothetical protein
MDRPHLEKPGAGLPFLDSLYVRYYVGPIQSRRADKAKNLRLFALVGGRISKEAAAVPGNKLDQRVLVPRMKGIEDSSRFWCVNETLEHVMITGERMARLSADLSAGKTSDVVVRIEDFKPRGKYQGADARPDFKKFLKETHDLLAPLAIKDEGPTHRHPWLGDFNALQWCWLLSGHSGLHLNQLLAIKKGLEGRSLRP